jgi:hypothetical protein
MGRITHEYRCTRADIYPPGSTGHDDAGARQGHYIMATDAEDALRRMAQAFPGERRFTAEPTGNRIDHDSE